MFIQKYLLSILLCVKDKRVSKVNITSALIEFMANGEGRNLKKNHLTSAIDIWQPDAV